MCGERLNKRGFLEKGHAQNLQNVAEASLDFQFASDDGDEHVDADSDPDLGLHGVVGVAVERLDSQILFDPFEEQLDLPAALVQAGNRQRREREIVGQEHEPSIGLAIVERNATQGTGVQARRLQAREDNRLIAAQPSCSVDRATGAASVVHVSFGARHEERPALRQAIQASKIHVPAVHHIERAGLDRQKVEHRDIVHFPVRNMHKTEDVAPQIQQRVELHRAFPTAKLRPRKEAQTQIDCRGVESIDGLFECHSQRIVGVQFSRSANQHLGEVGIDPPIVDAIGIRQRAPRNLTPKTGMIQLRSHGPQTRLDVAEAFAKSQLGKRQAKELIATGEAPRTTIPTVPPNARVELVPRQKVHDLCEHNLSRMHLSTSTEWIGLSPAVDCDKSS